MSTEIHRPSAEVAKKRIGDNESIQLYIGPSVVGLEEMLPTIPQQEPTLFFLDAHFPGEFYKDFKGYDVTGEISIQLPLEQELKIIKRLRPDSPDVIIVDDLRLYEDGSYENGNLPPGYANIPSDFRHLSFCQEIFPERLLSRSMQDEGYLFIAKGPITGLKPLGIGSIAKRQFLRLIKKL